VVALLVGGFDGNGDAAVAATLVDLAARGYLRIEEVRGGEVVILRRPAPFTDQTGLAPYERRVLDHLAHVAQGADVVPAELLRTGPTAASQRWRAEFDREVVEDARRRGLCVRRWLPLVFGRAQRATDLGRAAARYWTGMRAWYRQGAFASLPAASVALWDRHLAYAVATGAAPAAQRRLCFGAEDDHRAWSRQGPSLRRVRVRYWSLRPGRGQAPWAALGAGVVQGTILAAVALGAMAVAREVAGVFGDLDPVVARSAVLVASPAVALWVLLAAWTLLKATFGAADLLRRRTVEGTVVRARVRCRGAGPAGRARPRFHLAVDDAGTDRLVTFRVSARIYRQAPQGATVRMVVTPLLAHVRRVEVLCASPQADEVLGVGEVASAPPRAPLAPVAPFVADASAVA
jgi:hypothetical protein